MFQSAYWQQNCKGHCDSMLGSLSSLGGLVKLFIILLSEDSTQKKTRTYTSFPFWYVLKFSKFADKYCSDL